MTDPRSSLMQVVTAVTVAILMMAPTVTLPRAVAAQEAPTDEVRATDFAFDPTTLQIAAGTTVTWTNEGSRPHTVTAGDGSFDSGRLDPGEQFTHTFDEVGTFDYHCGFHPEMQASVNVTADSPIEVATAAPETEATTAANDQSATQDEETANIRSLLSTAQQNGFAAALHDGDCSQIGSEIAPLTEATVPSGAKLGHPRSLPVANSFSIIPVAVDAMLATNHAIVVAGPDENTLACGEVGGFLTETGALIIGLRPMQSSGLGGTVDLSPADDPAQTTVSLFLTGEALQDTPDISVASANTEAEPTEVAEPTVDPTATAPVQAATTTQETPALAYEVASEEVVEAPNGRTRIVRRIVIPESGTPEVLAATLADAARRGLLEYPEATVSAVFAYRPGDDTGSSFTVGRASVSRDGEGLDPGSDNLLTGPDDGRVQVEVATEVFMDVAIETEVFDFPAE